ncbi:MAG: hypothetical protein NTW32_02635 [Chloroflexi bacterium]|nr:hypothetical protein [Chloroflexota bacterium]
MYTSLSASILLAAPEGITSRSMISLLGTIVSIGKVRYVTDLPTAMESLGQEPTQILLLDDDLLVTDRQDEIAELRIFIRQCAAIQPDLAIYVMLSNHQRKHAVQELGAMPMLKGMLNDDLRRLPEHARTVKPQPATGTSENKPGPWTKYFPT